MKKRMLAALLAVTMTMVTLAGCGTTNGNEETNVSKVESSEESVPTAEPEGTKDYTGKKLRIGWWGNDQRNEKTAAIIDEFNKLYPGLEIEVEFAGFDDYFTRLNTQAAGRELPDVMQMDAGKIYQYASNNQLLDLTPYVTDGSIDVTNVSDTALKMGVVCDGNYGIACGMNGLCMMYNPAILEEAGCTLSQTPTMSEYLSVAETVFEKTGARIPALAGELLFRSMGGDKYASDKDAFGYTEEDYLRYAEYMMYVTEKDIVISAENAVETDTVSQYAAGEIWCIMCVSNNVVSYETNSGIESVVIEQPRVDDAVVENPTYLKPAMYWSVAANTELAEVATAFIDYYTNTTAVYDVCGSDRGVPISSEIRAYMSTDMDALNKKLFDYVDYLSDHSTPMNLYVPARASEASAPLDDLAEKIAYKMVDKEDLPALVHEAYEKASAIIGGTN